MVVSYDRFVQKKMTQIPRFFLLQAFKRIGDVAQPLFFARAYYFPRTPVLQTTTTDPHERRNLFEG